MDPMEIFHDEAWEYIFQNLDSQTWLNLVRELAGFENAVKEGKPLQRNPKSILESHSDSSSVRQHRFLSPAWKQAVDSSLEGQLLKQSSAELVRMSTPHQFFTLGEIAKCLQRFESQVQVGNPFLGAFVSFKYPDDPKMKLKYGAGVKHLLDKFGHHVRLLKLDAPGPENPDELKKFEVELTSILERAPNVRRLAISAEPSWVQFQVHVRTAPELELPPQKKLHTSHIESYLVENNGSLLSGTLLLSNLRSLSIESLILTPAGLDLENAILRLVSRPEVIRSAALFGLPQELSTKFQNLESLTVSISTRQTTCLQSWGKCSWPLKSLTVKIIEGGPNVSYPKLFEGIRTFSETLVSLEIYSFIPLPAGGCAPFEVNLPRLKTLILRFEVSSLSPFINLTSIEELQSVSEWKRPEGRSHKKEIVKTLGIEKNMEMSNIWEVFPNLRRFLFHGIIIASLSSKYFKREYERSEYNALQGAGEKGY